MTFPIAAIVAGLFYPFLAASTTAQVTIRTAERRVCDVIPAGWVPHAYIQYVRLRCPKLRCLGGICPSWKVQLQLVFSVDSARRR